MQQVKRISRRLKRVEIVLMVAAALVLMSGALALQTQDQLADKVVRLHVLANSDSEEDQALKLRVRDRVLERATELLEQSADRQEAEALLRGNLLELENLAAENNSINLITPMEMRVPPRALFSCAKAEIRFADDISEDFLMDGVIGADGATPRSFRIFISKNDLRSFVAQALRKNADLAVLTNEFFSCYLKTE